MPQVFDTPVLLLLFNRPAHTQVVLDRLRAIQPSRVFVHCDGPRTNKDGEAAQVAAVREAVAGIDWPCEMHTLYRDENAGLREGVYGALNWFFQEVEAGIVIEDDCVPDPSFFAFCASLLERYAQEEQVMHIGGSNLGAHLTQAMDESYFFSKFTFVWGWASWRRAWKKMSLNLDYFDTFVAQNGIQDLSPNIMVQAYFLEKLRATKARENNSWAYAWSYSILQNNGLSIVPRQNLVQNTGIGTEDATHTVTNDPKAKLKASAINFPLAHPVNLQRPPGLDTRLFYAAQKSKIRLVFWYLLHKLKIR
ncbi:MAG TPA: hypothetical protein VK168_16860 [Saprospiraceae bacterium]|nr:hypothetical protein [Saprospiraceae bacterium]